MLKELLEPWSNHIEIVKEEEVQSTVLKIEVIEKKLIRRLGIAIERGDEGIMVKKLSSPYIFNGRMEGHWIKIKPDYCDSLSDSLDVIILGGYYGRRCEYVSSFLLGVQKDSTTLGCPSQFYTIGKVSNGFSDEDIDTLRSKLEPYAQPWPSKKQRSPDHFANKWWPSKKSDVPDFWFYPQNSMIVSIQCMELIKSDNWSSGFCTRFPRSKGLREDKHWDDCMKYSELYAFYCQKNRKGVMGGDMPSHKNIFINTSSKRRKNAGLVGLHPIGSIPPSTLNYPIVGTDIKKNSQIFGTKWYTSCALKCQEAYQLLLL